MMAGFCWAAEAAGVGLKPKTLRETPRRNIVDCLFIVTWLLRSISSGSLAVGLSDASQKSGWRQRGAYLAGTASTKACLGWSAPVPRRSSARPFQHAERSQAPAACGRCCARGRAQFRSGAPLLRGAAMSEQARCSDELVDQILQEFLASAGVGRRIALREHVGFEIAELGFARLDLRPDAGVPRAVALLDEVS